VEGGFESMEKVVEAPLVMRRLAAEAATYWMVRTG
jgi:hypothetical protein